MARATDALARVRAWWLRRQGLTGATRPKNLDACLRTAGWVQTSGSPNIYLSVRARTPGVSRDAVDRAIVDGTSVCEVPGGHARPPLLVPREEAALALRLFGADWDKHAASYFRRAGNEQAFRGVMAQAARALDEGPLKSVEVRARVRHPDAPEYLTSALAALMIRGHVRRIPADGKLDSHGYLYELIHPDDRLDLAAEGDAAAVNARAIDLLLRRHGPATIDEIAWWTLLTKADIRTALGDAAAETVDAGLGSGKRRGDDAWLAASDLSAWRRFTPDDEDEIVLLPHRDPYVHTRWLPAWLASTPDGPVVDLRRGRMMTLRIADIEGGLNHHVVLVGGAIAGVWEYDPASKNVVARLWSSNRSLAKRVEAAARETGAYIRQQLDDFKLSAADRPDQRQKRLAFCKSG